MPETGSLRERITTSTRGSIAVERQQLVDQREGHAGAGRDVEPLQLKLHVGAVVAGFEQQVLFLEVEQGTRGDRDDELAVEGEWHRTHGGRGGVLVAQRAVPVARLQGPGYAPTASAAGDCGAQRRVGRSWRVRGQSADDQDLCALRDGEHRRSEGVQAVRHAVRARRRELEPARAARFDLAPAGARPSPAGVRTGAAAGASGSGDGTCGASATRGVRRQRRRCHRDGACLVGASRRRDPAPAVECGRCAGRVRSAVGQDCCIGRGRSAARPAGRPHRAAVRIVRRQTGAARSAGHGSPAAAVEEGCLDRRRCRAVASGGRRNRCDVDGCSRAACHSRTGGEPCHRRAHVGGCASCEHCQLTCRAFAGAACRYGAACPLRARLHRLRCRPRCSRRPRRRCP